mmetsp:Transcript_18217/g.17343  ORF Transcript_18217/g.17343 Transcript_18217/m.17343 type:complete len:102 (-) Transcript_18217:1329-1634(-)
MTLTVPIPGNKRKISFFYIPYNMNVEGYNNHSGDIFLRESETISTFRKEIASKMEISPSDFVITNVIDSTVKRMYNLQGKVEDLSSQGVIILYQIDPNLQP